MVIKTVVEIISYGRNKDEAVDKAVELIDIHADKLNDDRFVQYCGSEEVDELQTCTSY